jgi:hypothetical protein
MKIRATQRRKSRQSKRIEEGKTVFVFCPLLVSGAA